MKTKVVQYKGRAVELTLNNSGWVTGSSLSDAEMKALPRAEGVGSKDRPKVMLGEVTLVIGKAAWYTEAEAERVHTFDNGRRSGGSGDGTRTTSPKVKEMLEFMQRLKSNEAAFKALKKEDQDYINVELKAVEEEQKGKVNKALEAMLATGLFTEEQARKALGL